MPFTYDYPRPAVTVDVVLFGLGDGAQKLLLIERANAPFAGQWALPGGFVDMDAELEVAARRELREEAGIEVGALLEVGAFGAPDRDPRGRTISVVFLAVQCGGLVAVRAGDDAAAVGWHALRRLPRLAFDHAAVVRRARRRLAQHGERLERLAELLPTDFTATELSAVVALATGAPAHPAALIRRLRRGGLLCASGARRGREGLYRLTGARPRRPA